MPGLLYAVILRSSVAHGRIVSIDASAALKLPGVHAVITAKDMPGGPPIIPMRLQPLPEFKPFEQPVIAHDKVRYVGEPIAVVLAKASPSARTRSKRSRSRSRICPRWPIGMSAARQAACCSRPPAPTARWCSRPARATPTPPLPTRLMSAANGCAPAATTALTMEPRGVMAEWDAAKGKLTVSGAAKVPFFNRRILAKQIGLAEDAIEMIENDVGGGYGARGEFYPEDFLIPFAARHRQPPGEMDRGPAREPDGDEPRARGRGRSRDRLRARRHDPGAARRGAHRHGRLHAHQRRGRRAQRLAVHGRAVPRAARQDRLLAVDDQQDAGRHLSRAGPLRGRTSSSSA